MAKEELAQTKSDFAGMQAERDSLKALEAQAAAELNGLQVTDYS